ncbi:flavin-containing monooxygenase [Antrihabitans cavernicola]|uniref:NAD(P)/FAD-dependent oxidoreductase n=1 Tax=Antrihabitans cavernicola TaxID=2495913 RepID=A0A5A7S535_9NOCA|nr:NAD(P)/FAD-dependent oxidoreductase [Spelaeibacter cavernicola]KAA0017679.1 NAD(P)/FAD-dependent oxidoreductase [Spelaeibacter cavernicola]
MSTLGEEQEFRVVVVGAGLAGLAAAYRLEQAGITDFVVLEKADRVGGTWRDNTYPGCGVDIPAPLYSFSFNPNPAWEHNFALQPEILAYIDDTVNKFDLAKYLRLRTELIEAAWSNEHRRWILETDNGSYVAQYVIFAAGPITEPTIPDVDGLDDFEGDVFHSARWNHDVDLTGKRVAVVGTGASAVQFVPEIQPAVEQLHVFQRTASWVVPRLDIPFPGAVRSGFKHLPVTQTGLRTVTDGILRSISTMMRHERGARLLNPIGLAWLRLQVPDPELRAKLTPSFTLGCKRLLLSNSYLPALAMPNVELIPQALAGVGTRHVVAADGTEREVDVIIFGTGFDVSHPPIASRIRDMDGNLLGDRWADSPEAYLATTTPRVPNAFIMLGPNILVYNSFLGLAESQLDYVIDALRRLEQDGVEVFDVRDEPFRTFNDDVQKALGHTVFNKGGCSSYYLDAQGRNFTAWPWATGTLRRRLSRFDVDNYTTLPYRTEIRDSAQPTR